MNSNNAATSRPISGVLGLFLQGTAMVTGAVILVIEILGARMLTPFFGTSHFVWSAQITVTMLALAVGYRFGGWVAGLSRSLEALFVCLLAAAVYLVATVGFRVSLSTWCLSMSLPIGSTVASFGLFFIPLVLLAATGPVVVRALTRSMGDVGRQVGRLSALGTFGSVAGVLLTSHVLIPRVRDTHAMLGTAAVVAVLVVGYFAIFLRTKGPAVATAGAALVVGLFIPDALQGGRVPIWPGFHEIAHTNSHFGMMQVIQSDRGQWRFYLNDFLIQNSYDPSRHKSVSPFTEMLAGLTEAYTQEPRRALCLGMGVGIVPMKLAARGMEVDVVEINPAVVPLAEAFFEFDRSKVRLLIDDARHFLGEGTNRYDTVHLDAFIGDSIPSHLMTVENFRSIRDRLQPGGTLVMNTFVSTERGKNFFGASLYRTLKAVFKEVVIHGMEGGNVYFVASDREPLLPVRAPDFDQVHSAIASDVRASYATRLRVDPEDGIVLSDDFNPVDYHDASNREETRRRLVRLALQRR